MRLLPLQTLLVVTLLVGCVGDGTDAPCLDGLSCVEPTPCAVDADCDDGLFCNGAEACDADLGCVAGTAPACDDGLACTTDACDEEFDVCAFTPSVAAPDAPVLVSAHGGALSWGAVALADGAVPTYDLVVDDSCDSADREACGMESPEASVRDLADPTYEGPVAAGATLRVRACHPCTGECGPWSEGVAVE